MDTPLHPTGFYLPALRHSKRTFGKHRFDFSRQIAVMAIVNRTPDSFFDHGRTFGLKQAVAAARAAITALEIGMGRRR